MSIPTISNNRPNNLGPSLQESGSLAERVITKVHTTTSYIIFSIGFVAQSILSNFIYVGSLGRYTLDDLKAYFKDNASLENKGTLAISSKEDRLEEKNISESNNSLEENKELSQYRLTRHDSKTSVNSAFLRKIRSPSQQPSLYPNLADMVKLSTYSKTPEQRLAEMEKICN